MATVPPPPSPHVSIIVYSDFACPWCYISHKSLTAALKGARLAHPNTTFKLEYRPFVIDPALDKECKNENATGGDWNGDGKPLCRVSNYLKKFGCNKRLEGVKRVVTERGKEVGIDFHFKGSIRQTTNAHRLALKAYLHGGEELQIKTLDALFAGFFEKEGDIGCYDMLSEASEKAGLMTSEETKEFLRSDALKEEIRILLEHAEMQNIKGVPLTIINNRCCIEGAQPQACFEQILNKAASTIENNCAQYKAYLLSQGLSPAQVAMALNPAMTGRGSPANSDTTVVPTAV